MSHPSPAIEAEAPWDLAALIDWYDGDREVVLAVISVFMDVAPGQLAAVRAAWEAADLPAVARAAHTLKGSVGSLRADAAHAAAAQLEALARRGGAGASGAALAALEREVGRLLEALRRTPEARAATLINKNQFNH